MKLLIQKTNNKISNVVKLEMESTEFTEITKQIKENEIPVVVFTDTNESFLVNNINELINQSRSNTDVLFDIVTEDLISLGGSSTNGLDLKLDKSTTPLSVYATDASGNFKRRDGMHFQINKI